MKLRLNRFAAPILALAIVLPSCSEAEPEEAGPSVVAVETKKPAPRAQRPRSAVKKPRPISEWEAQAKGTKAKEYAMESSTEEAAEEEQAVQQASTLPPIETERTSRRQAPVNDRIVDRTEKPYSESREARRVDPYGEGASEVEKSRDRYRDDYSKRDSSSAVSEPEPTQTRTDPPR